MKKRKTRSKFIDLLAQAYGPLEIVFSFIPIKNFYINKMELVCKDFTRFFYLSLSYYGAKRNEDHDDIIYLFKEYEKWKEWKLAKLVEHKVFRFREFEFCCRHGYMKIVQKGIKSGIDPSRDDNYAIRVASQDGHTELVRLLLSDERVDPSADYNHSIKLASKNGHTKIVKMLLNDERVDPSTGNNYAIKLASKNGHTKIVKMLLNDERVDPSVNNNYPIGMASKNGHIEIVKQLIIDERVDPSDDEDYAIMWASRFNHLEIVKLLLNDERVNPINWNIFSIMFAFIHYEVIKLFLGNERWVSRNDQTEIVKVLRIRLRKWEKLKKNILYFSQ